MKASVLAHKLRQIYYDEYEKQYQAHKNDEIVPVNDMQASAWLKVAEWVLLEEWVLDQEDG